MKKFLSLILLLSTASIAAAQNTKKSKQIVPVSIIVAADQASAGQIDVPAYTAQLLAELNKSQSVEFKLVDPDSNPDVMIEIDVAHLKIGPRIQRSANKTVATERVRATNASGKTINVAPTLVRDELIIERSSSASFTTAITAKRNAVSDGDKNFNSAYNYSQTTIAVPGYRNNKTALVPKQMPEPKTEEFLFLLSKKDLTGYLAGELRKVYSNKSQTARIN